MPRKVNTTSNLLLASPLATPAKRPRDVKDQKLPAQRIVVHITGTSTYVNAALRGRPPLDHLEDYFDDAGHPFAHYSVDPWGRIRQHASERETPWAQGWGELGGREKLLASLRAADEKKPPKLLTPAWWRERHVTSSDFLRHLHNASHEVFKRLFPEGTPNDRSVAVEFIQWQRGRVARKPDGEVRAAWIPDGRRNYRLSAAQYIYGHLLLLDIAMRHGIPWPATANERTPHFLGHEDADPWGRGTKGGGWDPGYLREHPRFCWACMLHLQHVGDNKCGCVIKTPEMPVWAS